uniref:Uncharacterized protein n=1 Tax=Branchiostoma floridae TaxID=7739 RepID=C3ZXQ0_BRAFL|eukprot:XP_002586702.1 hypothetical protein BRAFLDRAFT_131131 [Branchiostoma floridae]
MASARGAVRCLLWPHLAFFSPPVFPRAQSVLQGPPASQCVPVPAPPVVLVMPQQLGCGSIHPVAAQVPSSPVSRSTMSYCKKRALEEQQGKSKRKYTRKATANKCSSCGQSELKEFGHSRFGREAFCASASSLSVEVWLAQKRAEAATNKDPPQN